VIGGRSRATSGRGRYDPDVLTSRLVQLALALSACSGLIGCADDRPARDERPDVVLITLDTVRADRMTGTEAAARLAPHLTAFATECRTFTAARSVGSLTLPAHASMMTGLYPPRHGARANGPQILPPSAFTLAERAAEAGYQTAGFVGSLALDRAYGIAQGFEVWDQPDRADSRVTGQISERDGFAVAASATRWLARREPDDERPLFLWAHFFDAHAPYAPPAEYLERAGGNAYDGEIAALDAAIGSLLAGLRTTGLLDDAVVMIVGDHGESLGEHGEATHGLFVYDATLHVPYLLRDPRGDRAGEMDDALVSVVDVQPTLLEAMGLELDRSADGASLFRRPAPQDRLLYCESLEGWRLYGWSPLTGWVGDRGKYLRSSDPEFFELDDDAAELDNRWTPDFDDAIYELAFAQLARRPVLPLAARAELDADRKRELEALGYTTSEHTAGDFPGPGSREGGPSPAASIEEAQAVEDALAYLVRGRLELAAERFAAIVESNPQNRVALERLIEIRLSQESWAAALDLLRARAALPPETIATHRDLARCYMALGREAEAQPHVRRTLELFIEHHERRGESEEAARYRRILADAPR
jgi:choline-sulfatase